MRAVLVTRCSTIRVGPKVSSVPSRLIGETVEVRVYPERLAVRDAGPEVLTVDRLRGKGQASIDSRQLMGSMVRKPGAFARDRDQAGLFPTTPFRRAYDALVAHDGSRADVAYVRLLHLATQTREGAVEAARAHVCDGGPRREAMPINALVPPAGIAVPVCVLPPPALSVYAGGLQIAGGV